MSANTTVGNMVFSPEGDLLYVCGIPTLSKKLRDAGIAVVARPLADWFHYGIKSRLMRSRQHTRYRHLVLAWLAVAGVVDVTMVWRPSHIFWGVVLCLALIAVAALLYAFSRVELRIRRLMEQTYSWAEDVDLPLFCLPLLSQVLAVDSLATVKVDCFTCEGVACFYQMWAVCGQERACLGVFSAIGLPINPNTGKVQAYSAR